MLIILGYPTIIELRSRCAFVFDTEFVEFGKVVVVRSDGYVFRHGFQHRHVGNRRKSMRQGNSKAFATRGHPAIQ